MEIAPRMLGSDTSRGYLLKMIAADFLAGASADDPNFVLEGIWRLLPVLTPPQLHQLIHTLDKILAAGVEAKHSAYRFGPKRKQTMNAFAARFLTAVPVLRSLNES